MTLSRWRAESANSAPWGRMYPRLLVEMDTEERASAEVADEVESEDTVEKVRSGDGHEEMAGVGERDGEGDEARMAEDSESIKSSIVAQSLSVVGRR